MKKKEALTAIFLFGLISHRDNTYIKDPKNQKLVMRYYYFINKVVIFQYNKK